MGARPIAYFQMALASAQTAPTDQGIPLERVGIADTARWSLFGATLQLLLFWLNLMNLLVDPLKLPELPHAFLTLAVVEDADKLFRDFGADLHHVILKGDEE